MYKKPPRHTRFRPGQSGNPLGRPKTRSLAEDLAVELAVQVEVRDENGAPIRVSKQLAIAKTLIAGALKGDWRATQMIVSLAPPSDASGTDPLSESSDIVDELVERELARRAQKLGD